jgi:hypothetical protein
MPDFCPPNEVKVETIMKSGKVIMVAAGRVCLAAVFWYKGTREPALAGSGLSVGRPAIPSAVESAA